MIEIQHIHQDSIAERLGLQVGDVLISVNGKKVNDVIDYRFLIADDYIKVRCRSITGKTYSRIIEKDPDDTLGLEFSPFRITRCRNRCIFCFVDQMPAGCRKSLYIKDDDFRASFLYGNYITLGALTEDDWKRIFRERLSPLYISIHTTDHALRTFILGNKNAPNIMESIKRLAAGGIRMHTQIVLCPGLNDGDHLQKTLEDLSSLYPAVSSIAVVPVGITSFRNKLYPLRQFSKSEAHAVIEHVGRFGMICKKKFGTRLAFASDELFIKAGEPFPRTAYYEEFPQIENGVGMVSDFLRGISRLRMPKQVSPITITVVTGESFSRVLRQVLERVRIATGADIKMVIARNRFFGRSVTVAGLLTGQDILHALRGKKIGSLVVIPANAVKEDDQVFLDNMRITDLEQRLKVRIVKAERLKDIVTLLRKAGRYN